MKTEQEQKIEKDFINDIYGELSMVSPKNPNKPIKIEIDISLIDEWGPTALKKMAVLKELKKNGSIESFKIKEAERIYQPNEFEWEADPEYWKEYLENIPPDYLYVAEVALIPKVFKTHCVARGFIPPASDSSKIALILDQDGDLYHEDNHALKYPLMPDSKRFSIIKFLAKNRGYQFTKSIVGASGSKDSKTMRRELAKIANLAHKFLYIKPKDFIQSRSPKGYRIGEKVKITVQ